MKITKKLLPLALAAMLLGLAVPAMALTVDSNGASAPIDSNGSGASLDVMEDDDFMIMEDEDGTWLISYNGTGGDVVIPDGVTRINFGVFYARPSITSVTIPSSVTEIGPSTFEGCTGLKSVTIPDGVALIGPGAFANCTGMTSVTIPSSVEFISDGVLYGCSSLTDIFFGGTQEQWEGFVKFAAENNYIGIFSEDMNPTVHYNSTGTTTPTQPEPAAPATPKVQLSSQPLTVDGKTVNAQAYNIGGSNFFKLRDVAMMLNGTSKQFSVGYDNATRTVTATSGEPYTATGGELASGADMSASCVVSDQPIIVNGETLDVTVYNIGGSNYFMLRDLGSALGFGIDYDAATRTVLVTTK